MQHKHFGINYAKDKDEIPPVKLSARLNGWKRIADSFYRGSEVTFIQIGKDLDIIKHNHEISQQTGSVVSLGYVPLLDPVYFLQIGICLENLIKGLIAYKDPSLVERAEIHSSLKTHNLKSLITSIPDYQLTDDESKLLEFLSIQVVWYSKYPIPVKVDQLVRSASYNTEEIRNIFLVIYNKLSGLMEATGALAWTYHQYELSPDK